MEKRMRQSFFLCVFAVLQLFSIFSTSATAASLNGIIVDSLNIEKLIVGASKEGFIAKDSYSITNNALEKPGTVCIDFDKYIIKAVGDETNCKMMFDKEDNTSFALALGSVIYLLDSVDAIDHGVNIYWIEDGVSELLDEEEVSSVAMMFISALE